MPKAARNLSVRSRSANTLRWNASSSPCFASSRTTLRRIGSRRPTLLWIDDFELGLEMYRAMFEALGFRVLTASSGGAGLQLAALNDIDVVVTDYEMPEMNGEAVAIAMKAMKPGVPIVLCSGSTLISHRTRQAVDAFCDKAGSREQLLGVIHSLLQKKRPSVLQPPPVAPASDQTQRTVA